MARLAIDANELLLQLSPLEKLGALHGDLRVPIAAVTSVSVVARLWREMRGIARMPGRGCRV